jgi:hypothetical protein
MLLIAASKAASPAAMKAFALRQTPLFEGFGLCFFLVL